MVFDLGLAMRKKEEFETSRLIDFEFRRRARATRLLATSLGIDPAQAAALVATHREDEIPAHIATLAGVTVEIASSEFKRFLSLAHEQLVKERGDPTPYRMA